MSEGGRTTDPVREVVERTVVRAAPAPIPVVPRPAHRLSGQPYTLPEDALEWIEALAALRADVTNPRIAPFREQIARACEKTTRVLRDGDPPMQTPAPGPAGPAAQSLGDRSTLPGD